MLQNLCAHSKVHWWKAGHNGESGYKSLKFHGHSLEGQALTTAILGLENEWE